MWIGFTPLSPSVSVPALGTVTASVAVPFCVFRSTLPNVNVLGGGGGFVTVTLGPVAVALRPMLLVIVAVTW